MADGLCSAHSPLSTFAMAESSRRGAKNGVALRRKRAEARRLDALSYAHKAIAEQGNLLVGAFVKAAENGDWRAAEALMNRIYGKPVEQSYQVRELSPETALLQGLSLEEKIALLRELRSGSGTPAVPRALNP